MNGPERLDAIALLVLSLVMAAYRPPGAGPALAVLAVALGATLALARLAWTRGVPGLVRGVAPFAVVLAIFAELQPAIEAVNPVRYDALFAGWDQRFLGGVVQAWRGALGRPALFTDANYLAYFSFYFIPVVVLVMAWARRDHRAFERASFTVLLGFYLSYVGYFLWPTSGPRLPRSEEALLGGSAVSQAVRSFLRAAEGTTLDSFPSGHTAISMLSAHVGTRLFPRAGPLLWAWAAAIVFSTVYVQVHYAVDLLAGVLLYLVTLLLAPPAARWLGSEERGRRSTQPGGA